MANWGNLNKEDDKKFEEWTDKYVPSMGKCDTLAGEIIRAINRLVYRYYNDGDTVDRYYGSCYNHSKACDNFLCDNVIGYVSLSGVYNFEKSVCERLKFIVDYLTNNPQLFETPNEKDCLDNAPYELYYDDEEFDDDYFDDEDEDYYQEV